MTSRQLFSLSLVMCVAWSVGCSSVPQPVTTLWQQIGIPQAFERLADQNVNKRGNRPDAERKPKLKRLADPANLKPEAPEVLKVAADIKTQEDLAPQKIKALKYLGSIGCGCYNKKNAGMVEKAFLEALEDCTPAVRKAALEAICAAAGNCSCSTDACNAGTCCTEALMKKMEEMAYKQDDKGCYLEPDASIRNMAANTLNACPPLPPKKAGNKELDEMPDKAEPDLTETAMQTGYPYSETTVSSRTSYAEPTAAQSTSSKLIDSLVFDIAEESNTLSLAFSKPYRLPVGSTVQISGQNTTFNGQVIQTEAGSVLLQVDNPNALTGLTKDDAVAVAVLAR